MNKLRSLVLEHLCSLFTFCLNKAEQSLFLYPNSSFVIHNSAFNIPNSAFRISTPPPQKNQFLKYAFIFRQEYITLFETLSLKDKYLFLIGANKFI